MSSSSCSRCEPPAQPLTKKNVSGLAVEYTYELIPDSPAATAAGYTAADRANAQVWYAPLIDGQFFYYCAWSGGILASDHLSSILVCRRRKDGSLVYAVNCRDFGLDTSANFVGDSAVITRVRPFILGNTIYLFNAVMTNIGPQLYAVDKATGKLKWALAYYTPTGTPISVKGDYSQYIGSNMRIADLNPVGAIINGKKLIFIGVSSLQNAINVGTVSGNFPLYTDQGFIFCINDLGSQGEVVWQTPTCAPILKVGDVVVKGGLDPAYDPFVFNQDQVVFTSLTTSTNNFVQPYYFPNAPAPATPNTTGIAGVVTFTDQTVIDASLIQTIWSLPGIVFYQGTDRTTSYTLDQLLDSWRQEQAALPPGGNLTVFFWAYVGPDIIDAAIQQPIEGNINVMYFKYITSGQAITQPFDAQSLNYWGNTTWGGPPVIDGDLIYFGTGQAHEMPFSESQFFAQPQYDFVSLKVPVVDILQRYVAGDATLETVNNAKDVFTTTVRSYALDNQLKSPRGQMSYSDALLGARISDGKLVFGVRSVPWDAYSFLTVGAVASVYPLVAIDGDVSSGPVVRRGPCGGKWLTTAAKSGLSFTLNLTGLNRSVEFNHHNLEEVGVIFQDLIFSGPNGALGGSNYLDADAGSRLVSSQGNMAWFSGSTGTNGGLEFAVAADGRVFNVNNSFLQAYNIETGKIDWETPYGTRAHAQVLRSGDIIFSEDGDGSLYALSAQSGRILWKLNAVPYGMNGGVVAPQVAPDGQVLWTNNYIAFGIVGSPGPNGVSLRVDKKILLDRCTSARSMLSGNTFVSWDVFPKLNFAIPAIKPIVNLVITQSWNGSTVTAQHQYLEPVYSFTVVATLKSFDPCLGLAIFKDNGPSGPDSVVYKSLQLINLNTYRLNYTQLVNGVETESWAWLAK